MKILHITPGSNGYEEVELLANRYSRKNSMAVIKSCDGQLNITGGFLLNDTPAIRKLLDSMPKEDQYDYIRDIKMDPFASFYYVEDINKKEIEETSEILSVLYSERKIIKWWEFRKKNEIEQEIIFHKNKIQKLKEHE